MRSCRVLEGYEGIFLSNIRSMFHGSPGLVVEDRGVHSWSHMHKRADIHARTHAHPFLRPNSRPQSGVDEILVCVFEASLGMLCRPWALNFAGQEQLGERQAERGIEADKGTVYGRCQTSRERPVRVGAHRFRV